MHSQVRHGHGVFLNQQHRQLVLRSSAIDLRQLAASCGGRESSLLSRTSSHEHGLHRRRKDDATSDSENGDEGEARGSDRGREGGEPHAGAGASFMLEVRRDTPHPRPLVLACTLVLLLLATALGMYRCLATTAGASSAPL